MSTNDRKFGVWMGEKLLDIYGRDFVVGDKVAKAATSGRGVNISICEVTAIEEGKLYLNNSKVAVVYPQRLLIVNDSIPK